MRKLPPRRLNPVGAAVAIGAAQATFDQQLREANLKMPIKDAMRDLARQMQAHLDAELQKAVQRFLGFEVTDPLQVKGRLTHSGRTAVAGAEDDNTVYSMDGVPVLRAGPQVLERNEDAIHAYQVVEQLLPEDYKPAAKEQAAAAEQCREMLDAAPVPTAGRHIWPEDDTPAAGGIILP